MSEIPAGHFSVTHGSLVVSVPRNIFRGSGAAIDEERAAPFRDMLKHRYPWLTDNSLNVLMDNARKTMMRILDEETNGRSLSKELESQGRTEEAIRHLKRHLEKDPEDADTWYALGELLCRSGRVEEGYKAFARGRELF
ncbi:MAG: tetratricopeptide repeat protein [Candidatus Methanoplasma sp.]|jgi:tetratricopeptide (TPR) repeat protein|nr:tetratricopeptide repeat protein [Candidatus Methanoplasma sp.]